MEEYSEDEADTPDKDKIVAQVDPVKFCLQSTLAALSCLSLYLIII